MTLKESMIVSNSVAGRFLTVYEFMDIMKKFNFSIHGR